MGTSGSYVFPLKTYELDRNRRMALPVLYRMLQDAAEQHAVSLGLDSETLLGRNLTWMLFRFHLRLTSLPEGRQEILVTTWPSAMDSRLAYREFTAHAGSAVDPFACASSVWILLDIAKGRPVHLPGILDAELLVPGRAMSNPLPPLAEPREPEREVTFRVRLSDIDLNDHVSNLHYFGWIVESVPVEVWRNAGLRELQIEYKKAARYGDTVIVAASAAGQGVYEHAVWKGKTELARARTIWE